MGIKIENERKRERTHIDEQGVRTDQQQVLDHVDPFAFQRKMQRGRAMYLEQQIKTQRATSVTTTRCTHGGENGAAYRPRIHICIIRKQQHFQDLAVAFADGDVDTRLLPNLVRANSVRRWQVSIGHVEDTYWHTHTMWGVHL